MTFDEFETLLDRERNNHSTWFRELNRTWPAASDEEIHSTESELEAKLPDQYVRFLKKYGGGDFCYARILSVNAGDMMNIVLTNRKYLDGMKFIAFNDDGTGGYYGFLLKDGMCSDDVYYLDPDDDSDPSKVYDTFCDCLVFIALNLKQA